MIGNKDILELLRKIRKLEKLLKRLEQSLISIILVIQKSQALLQTKMGLQQVDCWIMEIIQSKNLKHQTDLLSMLS